MIMMTKSVKKIIRYSGGEPNNDDYDDKNYDDYDDKNYDDYDDDNDDDNDKNDDEYDDKNYDDDNEVEPPLPQSVQRVLL